MPEPVSASGPSRFGRSAEHHAAIDSTNRRAFDWAASGAPEGALVTADHQTGGRGRLGRTWTDAPGENLLLSLVLRPRFGAERLGWIPLAAAVALAEAVAPLIDPVEPRLKWPNDLLLDGRKAAGLLLEARHEAAGPVVVLGLGVNVGQTTFPAELAERATSLALAAGRQVAREAVRDGFLSHFESAYARLERGDTEAVREAFVARMAGLGEPVVVRRVDGVVVASGVIQGVAEGGGLRLAAEDGERVVHAGEVTLRASER